jgi:hypothetical protein
MLGEKIGDLTGRVIGTRVLPGDDYRYVKMKITVGASGGTRTSLWEWK